MLRSSSPQRRSTPAGNRWHQAGIIFLTCLLLLVGQNSPLAMGMGSNPAYAAGPRSSPPKVTPNRFDPKAGSQSKNQPYTPGPMGPEKPHAPQSISHATQVPMQPGSVDLQVGKASTFLSSDGHLEVSIPGNAITAADLAQAGGKLTLNITQIAPASGSNAGGSGHWTLGTYLLQLVDAHGVLVNHGLRGAVTARYHFGKAEKGLDLFHAYTVLNGVRPRGQNLSGLAPTTQGVTPESTFGAPTTQAVKVDDKVNTMQVTPLLASASTTLTWQGDASISSFGKPDPFNVDLNAGGLTAAFPIDLPAGPGGLTPPVSLTYSSASTTEQHNPSAAASWVGEGWNLGLGSVNWSEHNVWAGCPGGCAAFWENTWQFSDPYGTGSELIPPDINVSTFQDNTAYYYCGDTAATPTNSHPCPILWHTANESHAKIYSYVGPVDIGAGFNPPCFRIWLPNGIMEEFGCTPDSVQFYEIANLGAVVSGWNLDMITDPQGNQIHLTYQQDMAQWTSPTTGHTYTYPRDAVLSTIEYDSPNCHNAQTMCTGANWAPLMRVNLASSHNVARTTGAAPTGCNTGTNLRCDDPFDLSSSGGTSAPIQESTSALNDIQVQVRASGTASWNTLRDYQLSYEQSAPTTITDPASGKQESVAGMLDLTQIQEVGAGGANALMYSGMDNSATTSYAYMKVFDLSSQHITVSSNTTLSYWVYPQSSAFSSSISGNNSTCVAMDIIFTDGSNLRDSGAVDQNGNRVHPAQQCGHLNLDQWNLVTSNIGAVANGKTISKLDIAYDQPANTGGYRGYFDDISLSNPTSSTPLFATAFENGDPQPTWINTVDTGPEVGSGGISNVGGICCGLTGPEAGTRQEIVHNDSAALPMRTFTYNNQTSYYEDDLHTPSPTTNCGPSWNTGNGSGCLLWGQSYANNSRYLSSISNGMGLAQSFSWVLARNNTHGVPGGGSNNADPLYCNSHQSGYPCNEADDQNWSRVVLSQESKTTVRLTQNGIGGQQTSTPVTETYNYSYQLSYPLVAQECGDCVAGMYWGNQEDADYLGYYNAKFMGFAQATVSLPDGAKEVHKYFGTEGWGVYDTSQVKCDTPSPCHVDPWWHLANAAHGHEYDVSSYDTDGQTLLKHEATTYQALCPPAGVSGTPPSSAYGNWNGNLTSTLDHNNPIAVCDIQATQSVSEIKDGSGNSVSTTTVPTYDSYGRVTQETVTSNGGTPGQIVHKTNYVWNDAITATKTSATGTYIISTPAFSATEDSSGNRSSCSYMSYDGQGYTTGQSGNLTAGLATTHDTYTNCGTSANGYTPSGLIRNTTIYDVYGNDIATDDADANAGIAGHKGCTLNSIQHTDCYVYDSTFATLRISTTNALNQTSSTGLSSTATAGFGLWPVLDKDFNSQTASYTYDALGRMISQTLPGETSGSPTRSWTHSAWCNSTTAQAPCVEVDQIDRLDNSTTAISRAFYDGYGRLVETRNPGPNGEDVVAYAYYDASGHMTFESNSYFVPAYSGPAGPAAFSPPDSTQVGTSGTYDGLERIKSISDPNSQQTITSYSVQCGVPGYNDSGCYELATIIDANAHQRTTLTDGFERVGYDQRYTGNSAGTYSLYATTAYSYDPDGNLITIKHPANNATTTFTYDAAGRKIGLNDPDRGVESYSYDPNDNLIQSVDARGSSGTVYAGYDGLNRLLWHNTTNSPTGARVSYTYDSTANGNFGVGRKTGESFTGSGGLTGSYSYTYDQRGQQIGVTTTVNGTSYTIQKAYDDAGDAISQTYPTGEVVQSSYTSQGWLAQVSTTNGGTTTTLASGISYSGPGGPANHITGMALDNGVYTYAASYDATQRLTSSSITLASNGLQLFKTQPAYDGTGNVTGVQTTLPEGTDNQAFCYDEQDRVTWAGATGTSPCSTLTPGTLSAAQYQQNFSYDTNGRLTTGSQGTYTYNDSQHLHGVTSTSNGYSAAYDAAGNMTCRSLTSVTTCSGTPTGQLLSYDAEGNLNTWQNQPTPTSGVNYLYDGEGIRVALQTTNGVSATATTAYIGEVEEVTTGGTTSTTTFYYAGPQRIAEAVNGVFSYLGNDRLGSPAIAFNSTGTVQATQLYAPYGTGRYNSGTMPGDIGFTGQHADSMTGLDYYVSRYYDPAVGQFISADSALPSNGYNPWGLSRYAYVQGNPETLTDPDGHCWPVCTMIIGAIVGAVVGGGVSIATQALSGKPINWGEVGKEAAVGAASGAIAGLAGPEAGLAMHAAIGAASGAVGQVVSNALNHKPLGDGVFTAALVGGVVGFASEGASRLASKFGGRIFGGVSKCGESFTADTPVATPHGEQAISTIKVGDQVQAYDPATKQSSTQTVQQVFINHDNDLIDVTLAVDTQAKSTTDTASDAGQHDTNSANGHALKKSSTEVVHTTEQHPWLTTKGWTNAGDLHVGDHIQRLDGSTATVIALHAVPGAQDMYDLTVSKVHTFAVGLQRMVVHNNLICGIHSSLKYVRNRLGRTPSAASTRIVLAREPLCHWCGRAASEVADHEPSLVLRWYRGLFNFMTRGQARRAADDPDFMVGSCRRCNSSKAGRPVGASPGTWHPPVIHIVQINRGGGGRAI